MVGISATQCIRIMRISIIQKSKVDVNQESEIYIKKINKNKLESKTDI